MNGSATRVKQPGRRLAVAARHLELAIAHINNVTQAALLTGDLPGGDPEELRLMVVALADVRDELRRLSALDLSADDASL